MAIFEPDTERSSDTSKDSSNETVGSLNKKSATSGSNFQNKEHSTDSKYSEEQIIDDPSVAPATDYSEPKDSISVYIGDIKLSFDNIDSVSIEPERSLEQGKSKSNVAPERNSIDNKTLLTPEADLLQDSLKHDSNERNKFEEHEVFDDTEMSDLPSDGSKTIENSDAAMQYPKISDGTSTHLNRSQEYSEESNATNIGPTKTLKEGQEAVGRNVQRIEELSPEQESGGLLLAEDSFNHDVVDTGEFNVVDAVDNVDFVEDIEELVDERDDVDERDVDEREPWTLYSEEKIINILSGTPPQNAAEKRNFDKLKAYIIEKLTPGNKTLDCDNNVGLYPPKYVNLHQTLNLYSPKYPGEYPRSSNCGWNIYTIQDHHLKFSCPVYDLRSGDFLKIQDLSTSTIHVYGQNQVLDDTSIGDNVIVAFHSDDVGSGGRFHCTVVCVPPEAAPEQEINKEAPAKAVPDYDYDEESEDYTEEQAPDDERILEEDTLRTTYDYLSLPNTSVTTIFNVVSSPTRTTLTISIEQDSSVPTLITSVTGNTPAVHATERSSHSSVHARDEIYVTKTETLVTPQSSTELASRVETVMTTDPIIDYSIASTDLTSAATETLAKVEATAATPALKHSQVDEKLILTPSINGDFVSSSTLHKSVLSKTLSTRTTSTIVLDESSSSEEQKVFDKLNVFELKTATITVTVTTSQESVLFGDTSGETNRSEEFGRNLSRVEAKSPGYYSTVSVVSQGKRVRGKKEKSSVHSRMPGKNSKEESSTESRDTTEDYEVLRSSINIL